MESPRFVLEDWLTTSPGVFVLVAALALLLLVTGPVLVRAADGAEGAVRRVVRRARGQADPTSDRRIRLLAGDEPRPDRERGPGA